MLYHTLTFNADPNRNIVLREHTYTGSGPFRVENISYATTPHLERFYQNIQQLPWHEQKYFSITFSQTTELFFLLSVFSQGAIGVPTFPEFIEKHIKKLALPADKKEKLLETVKHFSSEDAQLISEAKEVIFAFMVEHHAELIKKKSNNELYGTPVFLATLFSIYEQLPFIEISPDYNEADPNSPLLCQIIPTLSSFKVLQDAMHEHSSDPFYIVGEFLPSLIHAQDEQPALFDLKKQARPVELVHPDVKKNEMPHGFNSANGVLTLHDFLHCWRNSASTIKPLIRYMRSCLDPNGFYMSSRLWFLSDMDLSEGRMTREHLKTSNEPPLLFGWHMELFKRQKDDFFSQLDKHDDNLVFLIDMIINTEVWIEFYHEHPAAYIYNNKATDDPSNSINFIKTYNLLENIIDFYQDIPLKNHLIAYILAYRLRQYPKAAALLAQLDSLPGGLSHFFIWTRNCGLKLNPIYQHEESIWVSVTEPSTLMAHCQELLDQYEPQPVITPNLFALKPIGFSPTTQFFWEQFQGINNLISDKQEKLLRIQFETDEPKDKSMLNEWINSFFSWDKESTRKQLLGLLLASYDEFERCKDKDLILIMGHPSSGKSILINALRGIPLVTVVKGSRTSVIVDKTKVAGHLPAKLEDHKAHRKLFCCYISNNTVYIDYAGTGSSYNEARFIAQMLSIDLFKQSARSIRIIYVASCDELVTNNQERPVDPMISNMMKIHNDMPPIWVAVTYAAPLRAVCSKQISRTYIKQAIHNINNLFNSNNQPEHDLQWFLKQAESYVMISYDKTPKTCQFLTEQLSKVQEKQGPVYKPYLPWQQRLIALLRRIRDEQMIDETPLSLPALHKRYHLAKQNKDEIKAPTKPCHPKYPNCLKKSSTPSAKLTESRLAFFTKPQFTEQALEKPPIENKTKIWRNLGIFATTTVLTVALVRALRPSP